MRLQFWSYGGGVQSAAIAALIIRGKLPRPDLIGIADTEREMDAVWSYMDEVIQPEFKKIGLTITRVRKSRYQEEDIWQERENTELPRVLMPVFVNTPSENGGKLTTVCSQQWKQVVMRRWLRDQEVKACDAWLGISRDEMQRVKPSGLDWYEHKWPLIYEVPMRRGECINYVMKEMGWPEPPRSACWMCPNRDSQQWLKMKAESPVEFWKAVKMEREIRERRPDFFLHRQLKPLDEIDLASDQSPLLDDGACNTGYCFT